MEFTKSPQDPSSSHLLIPPAENRTQIQRLLYISDGPCLFRDISCIITAIPRNNRVVYAIDDIVAPLNT